MHHYQLSFNFREPYQVLVDAQTIQDAARFKMNLPLGLERTLHGQVKPMITQCSIRHLYKAETTDQNQKTAWIEQAKTFERRRCNHHELPEPLSTLECFSSVVDPKSSGVNKHRYVVASQEQEVRSKMRDVAGVPLVYINRSVMIMEPMAAKTEEVRDKEERGKVRAGLKSRRGADEGSSKRKREDDDDDDSDGEDTNGAGEAARDTQTASKPAKKRKGPKGPNPLSMKKSKKQSVGASLDDDAKVIAKVSKKDPQAREKALVPEEMAPKADANADADAAAKRKRRRKHKSTTDTLDVEEALGPALAV